MRELYFLCSKTIPAGISQMASPAEVLGKRGRPSDSESETNDVSIDWNESVPSDTELVIQSIQKTAPRLHGFVFLHQVYSLLSNRTLVDDDINNLRLNSKSYKVLHCEFKKSGGSAHKFTNAMVLIQTEEYIRSLEKTINDDSAEGRMLIAAFSSWLRNSTQISVLRKDLLVSVYSKVASSVVQIESTLTHKDVDRLINCGFLHYRNVGEIDSSSGSMVAGSTDSNQELFWLSHPAVRPLVLCLQTAEQEIVAQIRKTRYRELSEKKLERMCVMKTDTTHSEHGKSSVKKGLLSSSPFPLSFHLLDLVGRDVIYKVAAPATSDFVLRLIS